MFKKKKTNHHWLMILPIILLMLVMIWSVLVVLSAFTRNFISYLSCSSGSNPIKRAQETAATSLGKILADPREYQDKTVIIKGKFGGWQGHSSCDTAKTAMKNKTDSLIYDATGCLYMTNQVEILSPKKELRPLDLALINQDLVIRAKVHLIAGKIILDQPTETRSTSGL